MLLFFYISLIFPMLIPIKSLWVIPLLYKLLFFLEFRNILKLLSLENRNSVCTEIKILERICSGDLSPPPNFHIERGPVSCGGSSGLQWVSGMVSEISWLSGQKQALVLAYPITGSPFSLIFGVLQVTYLHVNSVTHLKRYNFILFNITLLLIFLFHIWFCKLEVTEAI